MDNLMFQHIDGGNGFDFGKTAPDYAKYRDIYPDSLFQKLQNFGIIYPGMTILDVGTGTGVLPRHWDDSKNRIWATDLSAEQIEEAKKLSAGRNIHYAVAPAESSPFGTQTFDLVTACQCFWYFDIPKFLEELQRILTANGKFCRISMEWLPFESELAAQTEEIVLRFNPKWSGGGYRLADYVLPEWAHKNWELETVHIYRENLSFTIDSWCGRMRSCRGVGASLSQEVVRQFDLSLREYLKKHTSGCFEIPHAIQIETFRRGK